MPACRSGPLGTADSFRYCVAAFGCAVAARAEGCAPVAWPSLPPVTASVTATDAAATRALAEARICVRREVVLRRGRLTVVLTVLLHRGWDEATPEVRMWKLRKTTQFASGYRTTAA